MYVSEFVDETTAGAEDENSTTTNFLLNWDINNSRSDLPQPSENAEVIVRGMSNNGNYVFSNIVSIIDSIVFEMWLNQEEFH